MKELYDKYVGKGATISYMGLTIDVMVKDVKNSYGKVRFLVTPLAGSGEIWTEKIN